jgi:hypothetical protein
MYTRYPLALVLCLRAYSVLCAGCHHDALCERLQGYRDRSAYLKIVGGYELDGEHHLSFIIGLEIGNDKDELKEKDLGEVNETIREALPHVLGTFGSFGNGVREVG